MAIKLAHIARGVARDDDCDRQEQGEREKTPAGFRGTPATEAMIGSMS
jgi:hypothetical protein